MCHALVGHLGAECNRYSISQPVGSCHKSGADIGKLVKSCKARVANAVPPWSMAALAVVPCLMSFDSPLFRVLIA